MFGKIISTSADQNKYKLAIFGLYNTGQQWHNFHICSPKLYTSRWYITHTRCVLGRNAILLRNSNLLRWIRHNFLLLFLSSDFPKDQKHLNNFKIFKIRFLRISSWKFCLFLSKSLISWLPGVFNGTSLPKLDKLFQKMPHC